LLISPGNELWFFIKRRSEEESFIFKRGLRLGQLEVCAGEFERYFDLLVDVPDVVLGG